MLLVSSREERVIGEEVRDVPGGQVLQDLVGHCKTLAFTLTEMGDHQRALNRGRI